jgi:hypothetical protein
MKYQVFVTPPSGVGGEWPRPARWNVSKRVAEAYAAACRAKGMAARVAPYP